MNTERIARVIAAVAVGGAAALGVSTSVEAKAPADPNCFGNTMSGFAKSGEMGKVVSSIARADGGFASTVSLIKEGRVVVSNCPIE